MQPPALALNLMIADRIEQRKKFADEIRQIVDSEFEISPLAGIFKAYLLRHVDRVVAHPNSSSRSVLFGLADFWNTYFRTKPVNPLLAA